MSIHKSLKLGNQLARARNVHTRAERMAKMIAEGKLSDEDSVFGLPKLKVRFKVVGKKKKKKKEEETAEAGADGDAAAAEKKD
ncbi:MAG: small basic protein [Planctomycetota bacterium]|jgi:small basic protein (TIGR04137 family)